VRVRLLASLAHRMSPLSFIANQVRPSVRRLPNRSDNFRPTSAGRWNPVMDLEATELSKLPPLAWLAWFQRGSPRVQVVCGSDVEHGNGHVVDGCWSDEFEVIQPRASELRVVIEAEAWGGDDRRATGGRGGRIGRRTATDRASGYTGIPGERAAALAHRADRIAAGEPTARGRMMPCAGWSR